MGVKNGDDQTLHNVQGQRSLHHSDSSEKLRENTERKVPLFDEMMKKEQVQMEKNDALKPEVPHWNDALKPELPCWNKSSGVESDCQFVRKVRELKEGENQASHEKDNREQEEKEDEGKLSLSLQSIGDRIGPYPLSVPMHRKTSLASWHVPSGEDLHSVTMSLHETGNVYEVSARYDKETRAKKNRQFEKNQMVTAEEAKLPKWAYYQESQIDKGSQFTTGIELFKHPGLQPGQGVAGEFGLPFCIEFEQRKALVKKSFQRLSPEKQVEAMKNLQKRSKIVNILTKYRNTEQKSVPTNEKRPESIKQEVFCKNEKDRMNQTKQKRKLLDPDQDEKKDLESEKALKNEVKEEINVEKFEGDSSPTEMRAVGDEQVKVDSVMAVDDVATESRLPQDLVEVEDQPSKEASSQEWGGDVNEASQRELPEDTEDCAWSTEDTEDRAWSTDDPWPGNGSQWSIGVGDAALADRSPRLQQGLMNNIRSDALETAQAEKILEASQGQVCLDLSEDVPMTGQSGQEPLDHNKEGSMDSRECLNLTEKLLMGGQEPLHLTEKVHSSRQPQKMQEDGFPEISQGNIPYCKSNTFTLCSEEAPSSSPPGLSGEMQFTAIMTQPTPNGNNWRMYLNQPEGLWSCTDGDEWFSGNTLVHDSVKGRQCSDGRPSGGAGSFGGGCGAGGDSSCGGRSSGTGSGGSGGAQGSGSWQGQGSGDGDDPHRGKPGPTKKKVEEVQDEDEDKDKDESDVLDGAEEDAGPSDQSGPQSSEGCDQHGQLEEEQLQVLLGQLKLSVDEGGGGDASGVDMMESLQQVNLCLLICLKPGKLAGRCRVCGAVYGLLQHFAKCGNQGCATCQKVLSLLEFHIIKCMKVRDDEFKCSHGQVLCHKIQKKLGSGATEKKLSELWEKAAVWYKIQKYLGRLLVQRESLPVMEDSMEDICPSFNSILSIQNQNLRSVMGLPWRPGVEAIGSLTSVPGVSGLQDSVLGSGMGQGQEGHHGGGSTRAASMGGARQITQLLYQRPSDSARRQSQLPSILEHEESNRLGQRRMVDKSHVEARGSQRLTTGVEPNFGAYTTLGVEHNQQHHSMDRVNLLKQADHQRSGGGLGMWPQVAGVGASLASLQYTSEGGRPPQQANRFGSVPVTSAGVAQGLIGHGHVDYGNRTDLLLVCRLWMKERDRDRHRQRREEGVLLEQSDLVRKGMWIQNGRYQKDFQWQQGVYLGSGMTGKCHMASDFNTSFQFCVKKMDLQKFDITELEIWSDLQDTHIVPLFGAIRDGEKIYIFSECIYGGSLQDFIEAQGRLNTVMALNYLQQLLHVLIYLKHKNILHEDLKADNILLRHGTFELVVVDFGVSKRLGSDGVVARGAAPLGGPTQWSPEKATSECYSYNSDVWACVCLLVHMLSGHPVWFRRYPNVGSLMFVIGTKSPPKEDIPRDTPEDVRDLILQGWTLNARQRPSAEQLLNHRAFNRLRQSRRTARTTQSSHMRSLPLLPSHQPYTSVSSNTTSLRSLRPRQMETLSSIWDDKDYQQIIQEMHKLKQSLKEEKAKGPGPAWGQTTPDTGRKAKGPGPAWGQTTPDTGRKAKGPGPAWGQTIPDTGRKASSPFPAHKNKAMSVEEQRVEEPRSDSFELPETIDITQYDFSESLKEQLGPEVVLPDPSLQWQGSYRNHQPQKTASHLSSPQTGEAAGGATVQTEAVGGANAGEVSHSHHGVSFLLPNLPIFEEVDSDNDDVGINVENTEENNLMAENSRTERQLSPQRQRPVLTPLQMPAPNQGSSLAASGGARPKQYPRTAPVKSPANMVTGMHRSETEPASLESLRGKSQDKSADELFFYQTELLTKVMMDVDNLEDNEDLAHHLGTSPFDGSFYSSASIGNVSQDDFVSDHMTSSASSTEIGYAEHLDQQTLEESRRRLCQTEGSPRSHGLRVEFHDLTVNGPVLKSVRILSGGELWKEVVISVCLEIHQKYRSFNVQNTDGTLLDLNEVPDGTNDVIHVIVMPVEETTGIDEENNLQWQSWRAVDGDIEAY